MSDAIDQVDELASKTSSNLSLQPGSATSSTRDEPSPNGSLTSSNSSSSPNPSPSTGSSRQYHSVGPGSGGPQTRTNNVGTGGPSSNSFRGPSASPTGGSTSAQVATGGPGSRTRATEITRQLASTRLPPSLQARLAAVSATKDVALLDTDHLLFQFHVFFAEC